MALVLFNIQGHLALLSPFPTMFSRQNLSCQHHPVLHLGEALVDYMIQLFLFALDEIIREGMED